MELTKQQKEIIRRIKSLFMSYFEGTYEDAPISKTSLSRLGITNLDFFFKEDGLILLQVTLERPGLLIGQGGNTLFALEERLSTPENEVRILIIESKLWSMKDSDIEDINPQVYPLKTALEVLAIGGNNIAKVALSEYNKNFLSYKLFKPLKK